MSEGSNEPQSDEVLMRLYVQGDQAAFRVLFERYAPILLRLTVRHLRSDELAREVVQQTFFQLHGARYDFRSDSKLRPWIFTIAMNLVREHYRRRKRRKETELDETRSSLPSPPLGEREGIERKQRVELLRAAMAKLPQSQREVVELHWFEERPFAEVAEILGSTEGAVRVRAHRAYKRLKELLGGDLE